MAREWDVLVVGMEFEGKGGGGRWSSECSKWDIIRMLLSEAIRA